MPPEKRVGRHDRADVPKQLPPQAVRPCGQASAVVIREPEPLASQLPAQEAILGDQIADRLSLLTLQPTGQDAEQLQSRGVDHGENLYQSLEI